MVCEVAEPAYRRGFGMEKEIWCLQPEAPHPGTFSPLNPPSSWHSSLRRKNES